MDTTRAATHAHTHHSAYSDAAVVVAVAGHLREAFVAPVGRPRAGGRINYLDFKEKEKKKTK